MRVGARGRGFTTGMRRWIRLAANLPGLLLDLGDLALAEAGWRLLRSGRGIAGRRVRAAWRGAVDLSGARRVAVFSHYDRRGVVHDHVLHYVQRLRDAGFAVIFVTNAPDLRPASLAALLPGVALVLRRDNVGLDFAGYRDGLAHVPDPARLDWLLFANDSVYGPFFDLGPVVDRAAADGADMFGITDNWDRAYHVQSYFVLFSGRAAATDAFRGFWRNVRNHRRKRCVVRRCEIGLTRAMVRAGLRCGVLAPYQSLVADVADRIGTVLAGSARLSEPHRRHLEAVERALHAGAPLNPTHYFWDRLILRWGCPFLKRDLLQRNPVGVPMVLRWREVVAETGPYDVGMIVRHLQETMRDRVY